MKLSRIYSAQTIGLRAHTITIEVDIFGGFHTFSVVGLPDKAVEESRDRVSSAIKNAGLSSPKSDGQHKVVVSLAPADLKKEGPLFDLPIALAYLAATDEIQFAADGRLFIGELSLAGELRPAHGVLMLAQHARASGFTEVFVPEANAREAALVRGITVYGARTLKDVIGHINTKKERGTDGPRIPRAPLSAQPETSFGPFTSRGRDDLSFADIRGQESAKRGLVIAAAGGHNIAFYGPPGTGKTLLARAFSSILPPLSFDEALEVTGIHSVAGKLGDDLIVAPPFRAPHHTSSHVAIIGGGTFPKPGEATLAHRGVLFLDEFPEFETRVIESLRQPLEDGVVNIARIKGSEVFPAEFILIAAFNPCPCGFRGDATKECICTQSALQKYRRKLSGPIMDRIDMWIEVPRLPHEELSLNRASARAGDEPEPAAVVLRARERQAERFGNTPRLRVNARMNVKTLPRYARLARTAEETLMRSARTIDLSPRAYHRVIKLARTIADVDASETIEEKHILEALRYRPKEEAFR
ncbi:MAG: YifB family Mg chelatase-like AAA ATPase [Parcubacteria group bacterium]|nr:YifB family Mg chelatase-like AAA ATPase [Parcubacteria group bacterium]